MSLVVRAPLLFALLSFASSAVAHAADDVELTPYGFIKPTVAILGGTFSSYGRPNATALTSAGNPTLVADPDAPRASWQLAQSRLGAKLQAGAARAQVELDFIDFNLSNPTTGSHPRLRQATVGWAPSDQFSLTIGQTWDNFAPLNPFHRNYVGGSFTAGNLGFMRDQLIVAHDSDTMLVSGALGFAAPNNNQSDGPLETHPLPTASLRLGMHIGKASTAGAAGFFGLVPQSDQTSATAWGANAFADLKLSKTTAVRSEVYGGQNLNNTGMLTLGHGVFDAEKDTFTDVREAGGWVSLHQGLGKWLALTVTANGAEVLNSDDAAPGYTTAENTDEVATLASAPGMTRNLGERVGLEVSPTPHLLFYGEGLAMETRFVKAPGDTSGQNMSPVRVGAELGAMFTF